MWNSLPLPFVCEIHTLKRCLYYNHLPHNPISAAHRQKITTKKKPLPWLSQNNQDPYADDNDKYTPWQRNEEKIKTLQAVAKIVAEAIFSVHSSLDLLREVFKLILLLPKQKPLSHLSQDWTETFDDDQSKTATKHLIGQDKNTFKCISWCIEFGLCTHQTYSFKTNDLLIRWRTWDVWCCKKMQSNHWIFFWLLIYWDSPPYFACHNHLARP